MKKMLSILLAAILVMSMLPTVFAEGEVKITEYVITKDTTYVCAETPVRNSSVINGYYVAKLRYDDYDSVNYGGHAPYIAFPISAPSAGEYELHIKAYENLPTSAAPAVYLIHESELLEKNEKKDRNYGSSKARYIGAFSDDLRLPLGYYNFATASTTEYSPVKARDGSVTAVSIDKEGTYYIVISLETYSKVLNAKVRNTKENNAVVDTLENGYLNADGTVKDSTIQPANAAYQQDIAISGFAFISVTCEDEELKDAFDAVEDEFTSAPLTTAKVNTFVAKLGESANAETSTITSQTVNLGETYTVEAPAAEEGYKFLYWAKGMSTDKKQIVSYEESFSFIPTVENTYLIAVYEPITGNASVNKAEFYNANGQLMATLTEDGKAPALPEMAGYENCEGWALYGGNEVIPAGADITVEGTKLYVAKFGTPKNVKINGKDVAYGEKVSFTAEPEEGQIFKAWKKDGVIVSTNANYSFYAWKDATVEAVYVTEEFTFTGKARKIFIDLFSAGGKNAVMAEFIGFDGAVEKGIMLGEKRYAMTTSSTQFTIVNDENATDIKGYAIFKDGTIVFDK